MQTVLELPGPIDWKLLNKQWAVLGRILETNLDEETDALVGGLWEFIGHIICHNEPKED